MTGYLICAVYLVGYLMTWRRAAWLVAHGNEDSPDGFEVGMSIVLGAMISLFWPILWPFYFAHRAGLLNRPTRGFLRQPGLSRRERELEQREQEIEEREQRADEHERRIAELTRGNQELDRVIERSGGR